MDFYQMPLFTKLLVADITASEKWYEKALGFKSVFIFRNAKNEPLMNHLRLANYQDIMLIQSTDFIVGNATFININVEQIEDIVTRISPKKIIQPLAQQPWNAREITVQDPDGHLITLTQSNTSKEEFTSLMKKISKEYDR